MSQVPTLKEINALIMSAVEKIEYVVDHKDTNPLVDADAALKKAYGLVNILIQQDGES
ncbi:MAG: hypothetical protein OXG39_07675 [Chloroflexi bacterium]|nr:hypothetical protein [Chloroflexota bacterium]